MSESNKPSVSSSATQKTESKNDKNKNKETPIVDPELDIKSGQFNPLKALYASSVHVPIENVPIYNNIAHYESAMKMRQQQQRNTSVDGSVSEKQNKKTIYFFLPKTKTKLFGKIPL